VKIKSIKQIKSLKGKRVLLRVDFNVPLGKDFKVGQREDYRIERALPTIKYLIRRGAKIIIMAHLGRPNGKVVENLRLDPVAIRLSQLLKKDVYKSDEILGRGVEVKIKEIKNGDVIILENIRFSHQEEIGNKKFAQQLAKLADLYVNDAFAVCHRDHASVSTIQDYLSSYGGLLLEDEIENLSKIFVSPKRPLVVIIGGVKISTKIKVIKRFLKISDKVLLGGALANTVLVSQGIAVGKSVIEPKMLSEIKKIKLTDNKLVVPVDGVMAKSLAAKTGRTDALADIKKDEFILDVGPDTIKLYEYILKTAGTVVWNGPMGLMETPFFARATNQLIRILSKSRAKTIVGGGDTVTAIRALEFENKFSFISTGGGAMLEFLEGKKLPGLKKIINK